FIIGANDQLLSSAEYRALIVAQRPTGPVRLADVAEVLDDAENQRQAAWMNETPAVILNVQRQPGANVIEVVDRITALLPRLERALPAGVRVHVLTDRTVTIRASVADVQRELLLAVALVVLVIFLFLRHWSATLIPAVAVPLSLIGAFGAAYLLGFSLNNLSLMALVIATGFVVDDAIVMIENIARYREQGHAPIEAALRGAAEIGFTILSLTISLIAVLIPLLFMGDVVGRLFREFALTLGVTILISAVVSLTLTPMLSARLLGDANLEAPDTLAATLERGFDRLLDAYRRSLDWVLARQGATLAVAVAVLLLTVVLFVAAPKGFFPVQDTGVLLGISDAPDAIAFPAMAERQQALARVVLRDPAVESLSSFIGIDGINTSLNSGRMLITLKPLAERDRAPAVIDRLLAAVAAVPGIRLDLQAVQDLTVQDRVSRAPYQYVIEDPNAATLAEWTPRLVHALAQQPLLREVGSDQHPDGLQVKLEIDRDAAARLGVTPQAIDDALYDAFGQRQISTMFTQLNQYRVVLEVAPTFQRYPEGLRSLYVAGTGGTPVPLSAVTRAVEQTAPLTITRQGQFPAATVSFDTAPGVALGDAVAAVEQQVAALELPASIGGGFQGTARAFTASQGNMPLLILAALLVVYVVLGVLYESYIHPLTILSTLPSAGVGALLALRLAGSELDIVGLIGLILLIGIVKKNAIMMIDFALDAERERGMAPRAAIVDAALLRFRPILMTTLAALLGALPLALSQGVGAELRRPLGITIVGGLIVSQVLTLYTTPVIYLAFDRLAARTRAWLATRRGAVAASR
ncbi:MAG: efflux RND transporter permease subunit, partial [Deltaproteobacteria bacterium]|nr:efflux RND transporter permease subunit [Deltaproteobacteria bacterium]